MIYKSILVPLIVIFTTISLVSVGQAFGAVDMFLKLDGIDGESNTMGHKDEIDVESWSWGATQTGAIGGGGAGAGKASAADLSIQKLIDKATPELLSHLGQGKHIKDATLTFVKAGPKPLEFLKYKFTDVFVSSSSMGGSSGGNPFEVITLQFGRIETMYTPQDAAGNPLPTVTACWDFEKNEICSATPPQPPTDSDGDGVPDSSDNCPANANSDQANADGDSLGNVCDPDDDNDGIADNVDTAPLDNSNEAFSDGTSGGNILTRGDQILSISDHADPTKGILISASSSGGTIPAQLSLCSDSSVVMLNAGDEIVATCGSITVEVISGSVEVEFIASDGTTATTTLDAGDSVTFDTDTVTITNNSSEPVVIIVNGQETTIGGGGTFVLDLTPPTVVVPANITEEATSTLGALVTYAASATDDKDPSPTLVCVLPSGSTFPLGTTSVTCTATDAFANTDSASFDVTVQDTTPPVVTDPPNVIVEATALCTPRDDVALGTATATDIFEIVSITNDAPECFPLGDTLVHWTATDANGNSATTSTQTVSVHDTTPPALVGMPADVTIGATVPTGVTYTYTNPTATDAVDSAPTVSCAPLSSSLFALGATIIECTASDFSGNTASASFTVDVQVCGMSASSFNLIVGTDGKDKIRGTSGSDAIFGLGGNDDIRGNNGNDCIFGGPGNDKLYGQNGNDEINGGDGNDTISGGNGNDTIDGGDGKDRIFGKKGVDNITGGAGDDEISGGPDSDTISGGDGKDKIFGRQGGDELNGDGGDDRIYGGHGPDRMDGGAGNDRCFGGPGSDMAINCESAKSVAEEEMEEEDDDD